MSTKIHGGMIFIFMKHCQPIHKMERGAHTDSIVILQGYLFRFRKENTLKSQNINMKQCKQTQYFNSITIANDTFLILPANLQQPTPYQGNKF
jgi:hypothetical protein